MPPSDDDEHDRIVARSLLSTAKRVLAAVESDTAQTGELALAAITMAGAVVTLLEERPVKVVSKQSGWYVATSGRNDG